MKDAHRYRYDALLVYVCENMPRLQLNVVYFVVSFVMSYDFQVRPVVVAYLALHKQTCLFFHLCLHRSHGTVIIYFARTVVGH